MMPLDEKTPSSMGSYDFNFKLMDLDEAGGFSIVSDQRLSQEAICDPSSVLPVSSPPILKSVNNWAHETFLENLEIDDIHHPKHTQRLWLKENDIPSLFAIQNCPLQTSVRVNRNATTGKMLDFFEENNKCGSILTVNNSCSLFRAPGSPADSIRGKTTNYPFWPGGMDEERVNQLLRANDQSFEFTSNQKNCPPGFDNGINFNKLKKPQMSGVLNMNDLLEENEFADIFKSTDDSELNNLKDVDQSKGEMPSNLNLEILLPQQKEQEVSNNQSCEIESFQTKRTVLDEVWAEKVDITNQIVDFHKKVPNMAREWPFELDTFQKQAVLQLENHQCVFVAAHTSAGKTVVAEYAIALSAKHVTRVIYTSPIKALSNQKFRDFKQTIGDVGLVTGDVQINPDAFCLIMTTEILRSMLYNGSDVIRDLEWVIFDEVHYINDAEFIVRNSSSKWTKTYLGHIKAKKHKQFDEHRFFIDQHSKNFEHKTFKRGVVWEEVLIMLPDHCNVILLSATVPNTMEFANWVGKIKRKKMHVISTLKRPVPLEHYLYTGNSTKTSDEIFLLVDHNRRFLTPGYNKAVAAKNERSTKHSKSFGAKKHRGGNMAADKNIWLSLINRLRKKDQLPVVAFTFSRRRCDENAARLESLDLTSTSEKSDIHVFFHKCAQRLKGTDRKLPQVLQMATLLERGVGVHHSGILPILKEVVEMLFAKGLVKLLFATETFAMGVNMPARTVVFDSIRKHDGTAMRNLLPGEYIQMAGRAGRRGLDSTGTVIVLCKGDVPEASELNHMMLGRPTKLESQFRLTYGMILNLLRVEQLRVEEVLKRSFSEFHARKDSKAQEERLKYLQTCISEQFEITELLTRTDYEQYLDSCHLLLDTRTRLQKATLLSNVGIRMMQTGRVVVLSGLQYNQHIAVVLKVNVSKAEKTFTVLVLTQEGAVETIHDDTTKWHPDVLLRKTLFRPENRACQVIIEAAAKDISYATTTILKIPADRIIADHSRRQIPRFSSDRPDESVLIATQELLRLVEANPEGLTPVDLLSDLGISQLELVEEVMRMRSIEDSIGSMYSCTSLPRFKSQVLEVESYLKIKRELNEIKFLLSEASLHLLPEYQQRVEVLKQLRYIDTGGAVQLKGRVACEISSHEIVLTELVFENVFSSLEPAEIVALLSCAVFQQRIDMEEVTLTTRLKEAIQRITEVATSVGQTQYEQGIRQPVDDFVTQLKFGLVEVVYEWANGTSFKDITNLTDVQEGVIVRTIQRLNETCRDVRNAARVIGDPNLYAKMEKCSELIKRDIVFAASLYTH